LTNCRLFIRSWRAAFRALTRSLLSQEQKLLSDADYDPRKQPPSLNRRLDVLERALSQHLAKQLGIVDTTSDASAATTSLIVVQGRRDEVISGRWWNKGMLLAALVESGGDAKQAGLKLIGKGKYGKEAALIYREEMNFVAHTVQ
jgi:hypothetical protein